VDFIGADEAKTHLPRLLDEVAAGRSYTITKHGVPVALLLPAGRAAARPEEVIRGLREFRHGITTGGTGIRAMIEDERR
jgi:prevent-host-death family protein